MTSDIEFSWRDAALAVFGIGFMAVGAHILAPAFVVPSIWTYFTGAKALTLAGGVAGVGLSALGTVMAARGLSKLMPSFLKPSLG